MHIASNFTNLSLPNQAFIIIYQHLSSLKKHFILFLSLSFLFLFQDSCDKANALSHWKRDLTVLI